MILGAICGILAATAVVLWWLHIERYFLSEPRILVQTGNMARVFATITTCTQGCEYVYGSDTI